MGSRRDTLLVVGLVGLIVLFALLSGRGRDESAMDPRPSSFRSAGPGTLALFLALDRLDVDVARRLAPWVDGEPLQNPLVLLAPTQELTPLELEALVSWTEQGGTLIYAARPGDPLLSALGLAVRTFGEGDVGTAIPSRSDPWTDGVPGVAGFRWAFADTSRALVSGGAVPLLAAGDTAVAVVRFTLGSGTVLAWSDVAPLTNDHLRESGAALVFARAAAELSAGTWLVFDEFHHGYRQGAGVGLTTLRFLRDTAPGRMALQFGVAGLGLLWLLGARFGAPHDPPPLRRRSPLEHVEALAAAFQHGGARQTARRQVIAGLARRLGRPAPAAGAEAAWLERLAVQLPPAEAPARALLDEWTRGTHADLVALARHADRIANHTRDTIRT